MAEGAIYEQLKQTTKKNIDEQIEWFKKCGEEFYPEDDARFKAMREGGQLVLDLLRDDPVCNAGTSNWLNRMDYDQLVFAKNCAEDLIAKKDDEEKVLLWNVYSEFSSSHYFKTFGEASLKIIEIMKAELEEHPDRRNDFYIRKYHVRSSELDEYLEN